MEVALETGTHPDDWIDTDDRVLATVMDVLAQRAEAISKRTSKRTGRKGR